MQHLGDKWIARGFIVEDDNIFEEGEDVRPFELSATSWASRVARLDRNHMIYIDCLAFWGFLIERDEMVEMSALMIKLDG